MVVTSHATITDPNVNATGGMSYTVAEGSATVSGVLATFTDPGNLPGNLEDADDYSATIDWGDGSTADATGTITWNATSKKFEVSGSHTYVGDLTITLAHGGVTYTLWAKTGGRQQDIQQTFTVDAFHGKDAKGEWILKLVDSASMDEGTLNSWSLAF